ncbi:hypothetical protein AKJ09_09973 [Labilithrix luteola]|uniref:BNR repeat domain protein n=2 Tax=Labilithrix luteola TaxID=1391654 RepID=A0A0K1QD16_9BACT|nr:hypothetical protein AKJ09_09973 [Labilithrix luteola]
MVSIVASCSSSEDAPVTEAQADASANTGDASEPKEDGNAPPARDAGLVDAAPLPIVCASSSCAKSLVTTLGANHEDSLSEGFCALLEDGTVSCWGANNAGQLGRGEEAGTLEGSSTAARVLGLSGIVDLDHTCAIDKDGGTWCWGTGPFLRDDAGKVTTERSPIKLTLPPATRVGLGSLVACITAAEGVLCWGNNLQGQLAPFDTTPRSALRGPQRLDLPPGAAVRQLAVGDATFIVREDGTMVSVGANPPLGRVTSLFPDPYPADIALSGVLSVDVATDNACATAGGTGYCWGAVIPKPDDMPGDLSRAFPKPIMAPEPIVQIATTRTLVVGEFGDPIVLPYRWCAATVSGAVYCWGLNESGQAGDGTKDYAFDAVRVTGLPERAAQVRTTRNTTCALLTSGKIYCWGSNFDGQLGNGKVKGVSSVPEEVVLP